MELGDYRTWRAVLPNRSHLLLDSETELPAAETLESEDGSTSKRPNSDKSTSREGAFCAQRAPHQKISTAIHKAFNARYIAVPRKKHSLQV
jgi:hypothetical protein